MKKTKLLTILITVTLFLTLVNLYSTIDLYGKVNSVTKKLATEPGTQPAPTANEPQQAARVQVSADDDPSLGPEDATVTVIEFSDFQCPYCAAAAGMHPQLVSQFKSSDPTWEPAVPKLKELAKQGKIKFVYRDFPLSNRHPDAQKAAEAAECADEQAKFWEYHDKIFENQGALDVASLKRYAEDLGLNATKFNECLDSGRMTSEVQKDFRDGSSYGITGTPSFFVNGINLVGAQPYSAFKQLIEEELSK
jgi:protein-disulfide isomerase